MSPKPESSEDGQVPGLIDPFTPVVTSDPEAEEAMRELGRNAAQRVTDAAWGDLVRPYKEGDFAMIGEVMENRQPTELHERHFH